MLKIKISVLKSKPYLLISDITIVTLEYLDLTYLDLQLISRIGIILKLLLFNIIINNKEVFTNSNFNLICYYCYSIEYT